MDDLRAFHEAVEQLPQPSEDPFGEAEGEAAPAEAAAVLSGVAAQLSAVARLLARLPAADLGLEAWLPSGGEGEGCGAVGAGEEAARLVGSIQIEELGAEAASAAAALETCTRLLLAVALYGHDGKGQGEPRPWAGPPAWEAAATALDALAGKLASLAAAAEAPAGAGARAAATTAEQQRPRQGGQQGEAGQLGRQELVAAALPDALQLLRPTILAKHLHERSDQSRLEPYTGPEAFERSLAAGQLAWLLRQLGERHLARVVRPALPYVLAAADDPSPSVQAQGLWALHHLACQAAAEELSWQRQLLLDVARRHLAGAADGAWPAAAAAAVALVLKLEGGGGGSSSRRGTGGAARGGPACAAIMAALLEEGVRTWHLLPRAAVWLRHAPALFPLLGLSLVSYFARLMPLLLRWAGVPGGGGPAASEVRAGALRALHLTITHTWPRMPAHAAAIWPVLAAAYSAAAAEEGAAGAASAGKEGSSAAGVAGAQRWAVECGVALWYCGGVDFQHGLLVGEAGGGCSHAQQRSAGHQQEQQQQQQRQQQRLLLEAVMERVEELEAESREAAGPSVGRERGEKEAAWERRELEEGPGLHADAAALLAA